MTRATNVTIAFCCVWLCFGCHDSDHGIAGNRRQGETAKPLDTQFALEQLQLLQDRYLLIPIVLSPHGKGKLYLDGGVTIGFESAGFSSGGHREQRVNLAIVDFSSGTQYRVFPGPVALSDWRLSFSAAKPEVDEPCLRFEDLLILEARTEDTNQDGRLDYMDAVCVFTYDLGKHELKRISPDGFYIAGTVWCKQMLVMTALRMGGEDAAVYAYEPSEGQGRFLVQAMLP